jgi:AcrR family transcriptional regulator
MTIEERIIKWATELFLKQGVRGVTMDNIAHHLGISKRTIYENFKDKDELLKQCIICHKSAKIEQKRIIVAESSNALEIIYKIMFDLIITLKNTHPTFYSDIRKYYPSLWEEMVERKSKHSKTHTHELCLLLSKGVEDGLFRQDFSIEITALILQVQFEAMTDEQLFPPEKYSVSEVFNNIMIQFTRGIATPKGLRIIDEIINSSEEK